MFTNNNRIWKKFDFILFFTTIALVVYGLIMVKSATMSTGNSAKYLKTQTIAFAIGMCAVFILLLIDYEIYGHLYIPIYIFCNLLLLAVLLFGYGADEWGASNWLKIGPIRFQPAEVAKFGIIISVAKYLDNNKETLSEPFTLFKVLAFAFLPVVLILKQPDFGSAMVFVFFIAIMIFAAGIDYRYVLTVVGVALTCLIVGLVLLNIYLKDYNIGDNYQLDRIVVFLNPELDTTFRGYQVEQSKIAIGSGMVFGRGLYKGVQNQYEFLPTKETDFIFAVICEELGFVGGIGLLALYMILLLRLIKIAKTSNDMFGSLIVIGIMGMFLFHILENVGMTMGLMPVTGIPLPFISYGGTFMMVNMISIGLVLSVGLKRSKIDFL